jgi:hypothetical protein
MSRNNRMSILVRTIAYCVLPLALNAWGAAGTSSCRYVELRPAKSNAEVRYENEILPWTVTSVDLSGEVSVSNRTSGSSCKINTGSDSRPEVYASGAAIAIRLVEISSDDIVFYDGTTCLELKSPRALHLGTLPENQKLRRLRKAGFCQAAGKP